RCRLRFWAGRASDGKRNDRPGSEGRPADHTMTAKLAAHLAHFGLRGGPALDGFSRLVSKGYHSRLEASVKVERGRVFPGRLHLFYDLDRKELGRAWGDFREFAVAIGGIDGVRLDAGVLRRFEETLPRFTDAVLFGVGIDLRPVLAESRIKFGLAGEP